MNNVSSLAFELTEQGLVPDAIIRRGIRHLLKQRLAEISAVDAQTMALRFNDFVSHMQAAPVALVPEKANEQHYELPPEFFQDVLGPALKYSCAYWADGERHLAGAERAALEQTCEHARLDDHQDILELGCGWGSLSLWMAQHYPNSRITAVSNSQSQRRFVESQAQALGIDNLQILTFDMNDFAARVAHFDRVVSVEMFEHLRNWPEMYRRIAGWLKPGGLFFKHIFVHRAVPYAFEEQGPGDWMGQHFFSGGMMPSDDLPLAFQHHLNFKQRWRWDGTHYEKTANAWLARLDQRRAQLWPLLRDTYGEPQAMAWFNRWRIFFMACAELFAYDRGQQWWVSHYLFEKPVSARS